MSANAAAPVEASLHTALAALEASGADTFHPVRFRYLKAMAGRCRAQNESVRERVAGKALAALEIYQADLSRERAAAAAIVASDSGRQPESSRRLHTLFDAGDFRALQRLAARQQRPATTGLLATLAQRLDAGAGHTVDRPGAGPVSELLREQEAEALRSAATAGVGALSTPASGELRAARFFRDARQRQRADKLVTCAVTEAPADCGPLNPQKLAIASMAAMRDLSPAYLGRFVAYLDTLFWLEKARENHKP